MKVQHSCEDIQTSCFSSSFDLYKNNERDNCVIWTSHKQPLEHRQADRQSLLEKVSLQDGESVKTFIIEKKKENYEEKYELFNCHLSSFLHLSS